MEIVLIAMGIVAMWVSILEDKAYARGERNDI